MHINVPNALQSSPLPDIYVVNTLTGLKEKFEPINPPLVGLYLCGPTVYGDAHLGHARSAVFFDVVARYLRHRGYKVRYVRNITDVGHLEHDADEGEDKISKKARLDQLEPMEVAQRYTNSYHKDIAALGCDTPSIEPLATGHIIEQIEMVKAILANGLAYESEGSVYFDVAEYQKRTGKYGELSGRNPEELLSGTRSLDGQAEKRNAADFALWKQAGPLHIMRWPSPWGEGFPGWHIECSAMSSKYLGKQFDIHGGGMDLLFPHHEAEIAQSNACNAQDPARYWMHVNMIQLEGQKMGKSLGNAINLNQFFTGEHKLLWQPYTPMTIRFFMLQAHYRSTLDFSNEALIGAGKALRRMLNGLLALERMPDAPVERSPNAALEEEIIKECVELHAYLSDDFNTAQVVAGLFGLLKRIHTFAAKPELLATISENVYSHLAGTLRSFVSDILGLKADDTVAVPLREGLLEEYRTAKQAKDWPTVDRLRAAFKAAGLAMLDGKAGSVWVYEE